MFTKVFWVAALERALKTLAQVLIATMGASGFDLISADWLGIFSVVATAVILSVASSVVSARTSPEPSPALFGREAIPGSRIDA